MPNQNDPTQNPNPVNPPADQSAGQITTPSVPPTIFPQSDLPPLPPAFQNLPEDGIPSNGSGAPPENSAVVPKAKKKFGGGRIIATILGFIVLVGGVGAGIILTQQKQLINQKAYGTCSSSTAYYCGCGANNCCVNACIEESELGSTGCNGYIAAHCHTPAPIPPGGTCSNTGNPLVDGCVGRSPGDTYCSPLPGGDGTPLLRTCIWAEPNNPNNHMCSNTIGAACSSNNCAIDAHTGQYPPGCTPPPGTNPPSPTPTPTPTPIACSCVEVKTYDANWTFLPKTQLPALTAGEVVHFCVSGSAASGTFDKALFKINSTLEPETITKRPSSGDFCQSYTVLPTDTTIDVKAKIHHPTVGWVGEAI